MGDVLFTQVRKRDGTIVSFDQHKIAEAIFRAAQAVGGKDHHRAEELSAMVVQHLAQTVKSGDIPDVEQVQDAVEGVLIKEGHAKTAKAYILYREQRSKMRDERLSLIGSKEKNKFSINALRLLKERYLLRDREGRVAETPNEMFKRVAAAIAGAEKKYDGKKAEPLTRQFYEMMFNLDFLPGTPILMNAGTKNQQLASCYALPMEDSLDGIFSTLSLAMRLQKTGAGTGFSFSSLRPRGALIASSGTSSGGPIPFMRVFDQATAALKEGGKGRGANMAVMKVDHPDILEFIHAKDAGYALTNFNISVGVTDKFMDAVVEHADYELKHPRTKTVVGTLQARYVWDSLITSAWRTGDPGILFFGRINRDNPLLEGEFEMTSACAEVPLFAHESCVLGSINVGNFVTEKREFDWDRLRQTIHLAVRFLDNAVDVGNYPTSDLKERALRYRRIGLGVMGFADVLVQLRVPYNSRAGLKKATALIKFIRKEADAASMALAKEKGAFPGIKESIYGKRGKKYRNLTRLSIAPTGSLSMLADCSPSIEPLFALSYVKRVMGGKEFFYIDKNFERAIDELQLHKEEIIERVVHHASVRNIEEIPLALRRVFVVAQEIAPEWHIKMQAAFQKYCDTAVSKTINFPMSATIRDIEKVYLAAWKHGCKGITIYRDKSKSDQVIQLSYNIFKQPVKRRRK